MRENLKLIGFYFSTGLSVVVFITFLKAYIHPARSVRVLVDHYGEADMEMVMMVPVMVFIFIGLFLYTYDFFKTDKSSSMKKEYVVFDGGE